MSAQHKELLAIRSGNSAMEGMLDVPAGASGIVLFAHGSGSSRLSPRNNYVALELRKAGIGTLLLDLLTEAEDSLYRTRFNIPLLTERLGDAARWLGQHPATSPLALGLFGASTGAAAALQLAASSAAPVRAVVTRGGRPDLAGPEHLQAVRAPTLLIVGGEDGVVVELNQDAGALLRCEHELVIVPGATHLFDEPGALEQVAALARGWFAKHLAER